MKGSLLEGVDTAQSPIQEVVEDMEEAVAEEAVADFL